MKVGIIIITYNLDSRIFLLQIEAIRKLCNDDFEIYIFDNSYDKELSEGIRYHSEQLGLYYKKTEASSRNGSDSHAFAANFSYQLIKDNYDIVIYLDHDIIPVVPFSAIEILGTKIMAGIGQHTINTYLWPGCLFINLTGIDREMIDFSPVNSLKLDTGGGLHTVVEKYGKENVVFFNEKYCQNPNYNGNRYNHYAMINDEMFMHFVNSSQWNPVENNESRINSLISIAQEKISQCS